MKTIDKYVLSAMLIAFLTINLKTFAQVGIGTTNPDGSSMLDIQSNAKGVLIPRMLTGERTAITTPANGLLVFDTDTKSFWFRDGSTWKELVSGGKLVDADGDTKVEVEKTADEDKIRLSTANLAGTASVERMTIDNEGNTRIGNGTDNTYIEIDGSLSYEGAATRWEDLTIPVTSTKVGSATFEPTFEQLATGGGGRGVFVYYFSGTLEQELFFTVQIPHGKKYTTNIFPHVHWTPDTTLLEGNGVVWGLEYNWANLGEVLGTTQIIYGSSMVDLIGGPATADKHLLTALGSGGINGSDKTLSSMLICRIFRATSHADDDYAGKAGLLQIDFHIEYDADGSRQLYIK